MSNLILRVENDKKSKSNASVSVRSVRSGCSSYQANEWF